MADRLLCAPCVWALCVPTTVVEVLGGGGEASFRLDFGPGPALLAAARAEVDKGRPIVINTQSWAGIYAVTTVRGTAACMGHLQEVMYPPNRGEPW
jgi:hypothetical protein